MKKLHFFKILRKSVRFGENTRLWWMIVLLSSPPRFQPWWMIKNLSCFHILVFKNIGSKSYSLNGGGIFDKVGHFVSPIHQVISLISNCNWCALEDRTETKRFTLLPLVWIRCLKCNNNRKWDHSEIGERRSKDPSQPTRYRTAAISRIFGNVQKQFQFEIQNLLQDSSVVQSKGFTTDWLLTQRRLPLRLELPYNDNESILCSLFNLM